MLGYEEVIESLLPGLINQAKALAWRHFQRAPHALDRDDLESIAYEGLCQARVSWPGYCERHGHSPEATQYFGAYAHRRMNGAILDFLRASDWVTRSTRQRAKRLQEAGLDQGRSREELAAVTGLTLRQIRDTEAGISCKPVSLDDGDRDVTAQQDVEGQATVAAVLGAVSQARGELPEEAQVLLALHYYAGHSLDECAGLLGLALAEVARLHAEAVTVVHQAMRQVVSLGEAARVCL